MLLPALGAIGGAVDFGMAVSRRATLQDAADAAALAGAKAAANYLSANGTGPTQTSQAIVVGNAAAQAFFNANTSTLGGLSSISTVASTTISSGTPTTVVTSSAVYSPFLLNIVGINALPFSVKSTTTMSPANSYYQIIFVVDVSGSMSIGGDQTTINNLTNSSAFGCAFACHDPNNLQQGTASNWCDANPTDNGCKTYGGNYCPYWWGCPSVYSTTWTDKRKLAKLYGYNLKIDFVTSAIQSFLSQISTYNTKYPGRYTVGINTFGESFNILQAPTTNIATAITAANSIDIEAVQPVATTNWGHTRTTLGLTSTLSNLKNVGDGSATNKMITYVIFLTDAVEDIEGNQIYNRQADLNYASTCTAIKAAGVNMFTIWAPYYTIPNDVQYNTLVAPLSSQMPTVMQGCASSSSQYFQANDGADITAAVNTTFNTIINNAKLRIQQ